MFLERSYLPESREGQGSALFARVRDIPYRLGLDGNPDRLISENVGNCTRKHLYLLPRLKVLGYKVDVGIAAFDWRDLPIPDEILSLLKDPIQSHMFLFVEGKPVDATWPSYLSSFAPNDWNGFEATLIGVNALKVTKIPAPIFQARMLAGSTLNTIRNPLSRRGSPTPFNDAFNKWIQAVERSKIN